MIYPLKSTLKMKIRVGGIDLDPVFCQRLSFGLSAYTAVLWMFFSFSTAVLLLTAFCFGAGILSISLDLSHGHQLPNFLSHWQRPHFRLRRKNSHKSSRCLNDEIINIPKEIDEALEKFYERILQDYIYSWYHEISYDSDFVQEIRIAFRHATVELWRRISKVDLTSLITRKAIPIGLKHLDAILNSSEFLRQNRDVNLSPQTVFYYCLGQEAHQASESRLKEVEYCRALSSNLVTYLIPKQYQTSQSVNLLLTDVLQGAVLQPLLDLLPDTDRCVNFLIALSFCPEPSRTFSPPSGNKVRILEHFVTAHHENKQSALTMDLSAVLKNQAALFGFMKFLKEENALNQLQFCLSVEDFNKRIMNPELGEDEMKNLHSDAMELYNLYFKPDAEHKVDVSPHIGKEIFKILQGPMCDVIQLRKTTPIFQAYEEVFGQLESKACPAFHRSEEYFSYLLGHREEDTADGHGKLNSKSKTETAITSKPSTDKLGRSLSKIKHGMLGKSVEGIVDNCVTDSAFDIADICDDPADILIGDTARDDGRVTEHRDLSAWRVSIPKITTSAQARTSKACFVFAIDVQRIDITSKRADGQDLHWVVLRRYSEFYALEAKLTEFHGEFEDLKLPPRVKFTLFKGLDMLQNRQKLFENYLSGLLQKPALRESDILYTFLTSKEEFTLAASNLGIGKIIKNVPMKLTKERGQSLQPFIDNFVAQTQQPPPKPRYDSVIGVVGEHDGTTERVVEHHPVFKNNFARQESSIGTYSDPMSKEVSKYLSASTCRRDRGVYNTIVFLLAKVFCVSRTTLQLCIGVGILIRNSFDWLVEYAIDTKLTNVLHTMRLVHLCRLLEGAIFDPKSETIQDDLAKKKEEALTNFQNFLRPILEPVTGPEKFTEGTRVIFDALQDPTTNKHLVLVLLDALVAEIFPELEN